MRLAIKIAAFFSFYALLTACAWTVQATDPLYPLYQKFLQASRSDDIEILQDNLLSSRVSALWHESKEASLDEFSPIFKHVSSLTGKEHSHFYAITGETACLSVNLITDNAAAVAINTGFVLEKGGWKVDDVMLDLLQSEQDFVIKATCPLSAEDFLLQAEQSF
ncbi:hypothetical protein [Rheinheimera maricola]|uniref:DUF3828 domain-containing protein n=1 Tax=Rheinheimera maricola TaxID=2793282 RepID=A0ABS7X916_9GAMM|nr:hypothetical protein [Rheinheimera maricola]MBZ9611595.1 hypothetical protein [Rheinheimera maricola]